MGMNERADKVDMQQIDDGILRAYLDGETILDDAARDHIAAAVAANPALAGRLAHLRAEMGAVNAVYAALPSPEPDATHRERAYRRIQTRIDTELNAGMVNSIKGRFTTMTTNHRAAQVRRYAFGGGLAAVVLAFLLIFAPVGSVLSAALDKFRYQPTKFAVITVKTSDFPQFAGNSPAGTKPNGTKPAGNKPAGAAGAPDPQQAMQELSKYVTITSSIGQGQLPGRPVKSAAEAQAVVGRPVSAPTTLPQGVANTPQYFVSDKQTADATLNLAEIRPILAQAGMASLLPPADNSAKGNTPLSPGSAASPATSDRATVHLDAPAASIISYGFDPTAQGATAAQNQKGVAVIAMGSPTIEVNGLDVPGIVNTIAAVPGFPPELAAQLKKADLEHTLIVPVTDDQVVKNGTINNAPSTTISQKDDSMSVVLWITSDNVLHAVIGTYGASDVENVAKSVK
jgi:hypothetical protein